MIRRALLLSRNILPLTTQPAGLCSGGKVNFPKSHIVNQDSQISENDFRNLAKRTLDRISEQLESLPDEVDCEIGDEYDVTFNGDVLTLRLGSNRGTYVLNTQTPNRQIWLSSPKTGPRRYDWNGEKWIYRHDGGELGSLMSTELTKIFNEKIEIDPYESD